MADRICAACGASNPPTATFCRVCDAYIDWVGSTQAEPEAAPRPPQAPVGEEPSTARTDPRAEVPVATVETTDVVVAPGEPGTTNLHLKNASQIVDGLVVQPAAPPSWLVMTQEDAHLMPGESRSVAVTFATRPGALVVAQQLALELLVRSSVDVSKFTPVTVTVTVPRLGPPPTLTPRPALVHLEDETEGGFTLSFDNRAANFPRRYRMSVHDPEDVVRTWFVPPVVDVPAGETIDIGVRFTAPAPDAGRETTRLLTLSGTGEDIPVSATLTLTQRTAAPPPRVPVVVRLEPSHLRSVEGRTVDFEVLVDNRASHVAAAVALTGRDPQRLVALSFAEAQLVVLPGTVASVRAQARTAPPPAGTAESRPFTVVANDGTSEVEGAGVLEVSSRPAPITTARLQVAPATLATQRRRGAFQVYVDNRAGAETLQVQLSGADEFGRARLTFVPPTMAVPPGQVGTARLMVDSRPPPAGTTLSRRLQITASDGRAAVAGEAVLAQSAPDRRPLAKRWLVVIGAILAIVGALLPWLGQVIDPEGVVAAATSEVGAADGSYAVTATAASTLLVLVLALLMLLGLTGSNGRGIRVAALLMVLVAIPAGIFGTPATGLVLVLLGAVLGFIGGVLARSGAAR